MSDEDGNDDDLDLEGASSLVKDLRKQLKDQKKAAAEAAAELATFRAKDRTQSVATLLQKAGADAAYAEFYTSDDSSEEAVTAWIQSKSKLLGIAEPDNTDPDVAAAARAISNASSTAPQKKVGSLPDLAARISNAKTREEFDAALTAANIPH